MRESIKKLADDMDSCGTWGAERAFDRWVKKQKWRQAFPPVREISVGNVSLAESAV